jgi:ferredoxin--NADP+ reductase
MQTATVGRAVSSVPVPGSDSAPNATLSGRVDLTPTIAHFVVRPDDGAPAFVPGQYLALGLPVDGRLLQRPYSTASKKGTRDELDFLVRLVRDGAFTPRLWHLDVGDRLRIGRPKGLFTLCPEDPRRHLFIATGTGLAPFVSMLGTLLRESRPPRAIVLHGVSHVGELAYRDRLERWAADAGDISYVPAISRPNHPANADWRGATGRIDTALGPLCDALDVDPAETVAYMCGNPEMIAAGERILEARGFPRDAIRSEHYWPAGSPARA